MAAPAEKPHISRPWPVLWRAIEWAIITLNRPTPPFNVSCVALESHELTSSDLPRTFIVRCDAHAIADTPERSPISTTVPVLTLGCCFAREAAPSCRTANAAGWPPAPIPVPLPTQTLTHIIITAPNATRQRRQTAPLRTWRRDCAHAGSPLFCAPHNHSSACHPQYHSKSSN